MRVTIYFDVKPQITNTTEIYPTCNPHEKPKGATRYKVEVEIPDPAKPDKVLVAADGAQEAELVF